MRQPESPKKKKNAISSVSLSVLTCLCVIKMKMKRKNIATRKCERKIDVCVCVCVSIRILSDFLVPSTKITIKIITTATANSTITISVQNSPLVEENTADCQTRTVQSGREDGRVRSARP